MLRRWTGSARGRRIEPLDVVRNAKPTALIGVSGQPGAFTDTSCAPWPRSVERPVIFPLSNPTSRSEATPADLMRLDRRPGHHRHRQPVSAARARRQAPSPSTRPTTPTSFPASGSAPSRCRRGASPTRCSWRRPRRWPTLSPARDDSARPSAAAGDRAAGDLGRGGARRRAAGDEGGADAPTRSAISTRRLPPRCGTRSICRIADRYEPERANRRMDRSKQPDRAFRRQHSAARRRDRVPHLVGGGRATPVRLPDGETGIRKTWIRFLQDVLAENPAIELAKDVPPFKFMQWDGKVMREIPRLRVKPGATPDAADVQDRLCRHGDRILGAVRAPAEGGRHPGRRQVPDLHPDADRADLQQHGAGRPAEAAAGADAAFHRRGREDRQGAAQRPHRDAMGRVPGGAGLGGLLRARARSISAPRRSMC